MFEQSILRIAFLVVAGISFVFTLGSRELVGSEPPGPPSQTGTSNQAGTPNQDRIESALRSVEQNDLGEANRILGASRPDADWTNEERFLYGMILYLQATERFSQAMYAHGGLGGRTIILPLPSAIGDPNPRPQRVSYAIMQAVLDRLRLDMEEVDSNLKRIDDDSWKLPIRAFEIKLDLDGDGTTEDEETLAAVVGRTLGIVGAAPLDVDEIAFDQTDVHWFRAQCLLISALCDFVLAHDWQELWNHVAPNTFANTDSPFDELIRNRSSRVEADAFLVFHLMSWELKEPERVTRSGDKLTTMTTELRACIRSSKLESDDDREWFPGPNQTSVVQAFKTTNQSLGQVDQLLDTTEKLLKGEELLPPVRSIFEQFSKGEQEGKIGINIRKYFEKPTDFDFVLMLQGSRAAPYLEEGTIDYNVWMQLVNIMISGDLTAFGIDLMLTRP